MSTDARLRAELAYWKAMIEGALALADSLCDSGELSESGNTALRFMLSDYGLEGYVDDWIEENEPPTYTVEAS